MGENSNMVVVEVKLKSTEWIQADRDIDETSALQTQFCGNRVTRRVRLGRESSGPANSAGKSRSPAFEGRDCGSCDRVTPNRHGRSEQCWRSFAIGNGIGPYWGARRIH